MARKGQVAKRDVLPDPVYNSKTQTYWWCKLPSTSRGFWRKKNDFRIEMVSQLFSFEK